MIQQTYFATQINKSMRNNHIWSPVSRLIDFRIQEYLVSSYIKDVFLQTSMYIRTQSLAAVLITTRITMGRNNATEIYFHIREKLE
jgi:hypothetical protein